MSGLRGIGIDTEAVARFADPDLRLFTDREAAYCLAQAKPAESFAGRWCAKEAVVKAFGAITRAGIREVEIVEGEFGEPVAVLSERLRELGYGVLVSIAHDESRAIAAAALTLGVSSE
ncbi:4'-phosphopantetheinyl transferase superfamily protein [Epidermidibacterium keratini]|uniref:4'-phosphopantetheinyl transferase superfamily protein n=1 Tax=Epidermidibacterium keratini TaxID=1891644 RepID=A0A7L4YTV2_9ACTN|nr:4'-phosphopantetheinyl transferase superfamily protein [Epidermidibacterium keratini]